MTDEPKPSDEPSPKSNAESMSKQEVPPGMLPLVDPVFGKHAFLITAVPFLIYLAGTGFGAHLEHIRKVQPDHDMRGQCRSQANELRQALTKANAEEVLERIDMDGVQRALDDESSELSKLVQDCDKLLNANFDDLPDRVRSELTRLQENVAHFLELHALVEEDKIDGIVQKHIEWSKKQGLPPPELNTPWYPTLYAIACIASFVVVLFAMPGYLTVPFRISGFAVGVGVVGIVVWLGLWALDKYFLGLGAYISPNARAAFNPWVELADNPTWMYTFVAIRLLGLCLVIPIAEEFFSRGFLMRYIEDIDWDQIPLGEATWKGIAGILAYGAMSHQGEILAALAWFGLVTWMYLKTKNIWDCVVAHSVTNTLLAAYVICTGTWELW